MPEVARTVTPLDDATLIALLIQQFAETFGRAPSRNEAAFLSAHVWLETAHGRAITHHNWGNLSADPNRGGDYWRPPWFEVDEGSSARELELHELMLEGKLPEAFRAYSSHVEGARAYLELLKRKRFCRIVQNAGAGDAVRMARAIQESGYCPDCEVGPTARTLERLAGEALGFEAVQRLRPAQPRRTKMLWPIVLGGLGVSAVIGGLVAARRSSSPLRAWLRKLRLMERLS